MKPGYLYVLVHPSDPDLYKVGVTIRDPKERLAQHNRNFEECAGKIVKGTGLKWELKTYIPVPDPYWAEVVFWGATGLAEIPYRGGIEVQRMAWGSVQAGLDAAKHAGMRPPKPVPDWVLAYTAWMRRRLEGRGITLLGHVRSKFGRSDFLCSSGHQWRATPNDVAEGAGCPRCGIGRTELGEARHAAPSATLCLLVHSDKPGFIRVELTRSELDQCLKAGFSGGWEIHRYRRVEDAFLAESLIWELLGHPFPNDREPIAIDLHRAEQAFRNLVPRLHRDVAKAERAREAS